MALRMRNGYWHYRFKYKGQEHRQHGFGRHRTKQQSRASNRSSSLEGAEVGKDARIADGDDYLP